MSIAKFASGVNTSFSSQLNSNFSAALTVAGMNTIRQLIDRAGVWSIKSIEGWGDAYVSSGGRESSVDAATTATFSSNKYTYARVFALSGTTETNTETTETNNNASSSTVTITANDNIMFTTIGFQCSGTSANRIITIAIKRAGNTLATKTSASANWVAGGTLTFASTDYSDYIHSGDTITIETSGGSGALSYLSAQSFTGSLFSFTNQTVNGCSVAQGGTSTVITATKLSSTTPIDMTVVHNIPTGTFSATVSSAIGVPMIATSDWETGNDIKYKLTNGSEDSGWLDCGTSPLISTFTAFTSEPTKLTVKLVPATPGTSTSKPGIRGFWVLAK